MGGALPTWLDGSVGAKLCIYAFVCICYGNIYAFRVLIKNQLINNLQTLPIISILILLRFFRASCTVRGGTYFAATGCMGASTAGGGASPRSVWFFPASNSSATVLPHVCFLALVLMECYWKIPWRVLTNSPQANFPFCVIFLIYLFRYRACLRSNYSLFPKLRYSSGCSR